jgi:cysteine desulfurase
MAIFLDHAATTDLRQSAKDALLRALSELGNPSSVHTHGQATRELLEQARDKVALAIDADRSEIIFLSGGTEANNQAIKGLWWQRSAEGKRVIVSAATEHKALVDPIQWLVETEGAELVEVPVAFSGELDLNFLELLLNNRSDEIALISLMWVNNETGVISDIQKVCALARPFDIPVHSDAVAAIGRIPVSFSISGLTAMTISGHKFGAPIGIGALVVKRTSGPVSLLHGGGQERGLRSGTMNYPLAAAMAEAIAESVGEREQTQRRLEQIRNWIESEVLSLVPEVLRTAGSARRVTHNAHFIFPTVSNDSLLFLLDQQGVSVSAGSACQAGVLGPSHVLLAMGYSSEDAASCLRVTLGHSSTMEDARGFIEALKVAYPKAKQASRHSR